MGCLVFFLQFFLIFMMLSSLTYMNLHVDVLAALNEAALTDAYSLFGVDLMLRTKLNWWPNILLSLTYVVVYCSPDMIRQHIANKKAKKEWLEGLSEEERRVVEEEGNKKDPLSIVMILLKLANPLLVFWISIGVPGFFVVYWIANRFWRAVYFYAVKFVYRKGIPAIKKLSAKNRPSEIKIEEVETVVVTEADAAAAKEKEQEAEATESGNN